MSNIPQDPPDNQDPPAEEPPKKKKPAKYRQLSRFYRMISEDVPLLVPGIITNGVNMLAGRPKQGKSWLALEIARGVATGTKVLNYFDVPVATGVLSYFLEDEDERLASRVKIAFDSEIEGKRIWCVKELSGEYQIEVDVLALRALGADIGLVIIDPMVAMPRAPVSKKVHVDPFKRDFDMLVSLRQLGKRLQVAMLLVHHTSKPKGGYAGSPLDAVMGTTGVTAAIETLLSVEKRADHSVLHITSRDMKDLDLVIVEDIENGKSWQVGATQQEFARRRLVDLIRSEILEEGKTAAQIAHAVGRKANQIRGQLALMVERGEAYKTAEGVYRAIPETTIIQ